MAAADRRPLRRRATRSPSLLCSPVRRPSVRHRHRQPGPRRCAGTTRSATTLASARSRRTSNILGSPNFDDGDRNFSNGSLVTNRLDLLSEFDLIYQRKLRFPRERRRMVRRRVRQSRQQQQRDREHAGRMACPAAGILSPYTKRYAKGLSGEFLDAFAFANFDVARRAGQRQGRTAHRLLGREPASRRRHPRHFVRAELARRVEGLRDAGQRGEGAVPAARRAHAAGAADARTCRSPASGSTTGRRSACPSRAAT